MGDGGSTPLPPTNAECPGGEGAVLKTVGPERACGFESCALRHYASVA